MRSTTETDMKLYPAYKESGIDHIGQIPKHWKLARIGAVLRERKETNMDGHVSMILSVMRKRGVIPYDEKGNVGNKASEDITRYKIVEPRDIVINSMNVIIGSVGLSKHRGCLSPVYYVLKNRSEQDLPEYIAAYFQTETFQTSLVGLGNGILAHRMRIPMELLKSEPIPAPPTNEQAAIVRHLDDAEQRIRTYVSAKERLIALLEEMKQAIIHQAVTRGLDPNVTLKPSGVEWLGDVPEHWEIQQLKQKSRIFRGRFSHRPRNDASLYDGPYPFIQTGDIARAGKWITTYEQTLNDRGLAVSQMFPRGTLVMTIAANIGDVAILDLDACFPDSVVGFSPGRNVDRDYLYNVFQSMKTEFLRLAPVNTQGNLNVDRIGAAIVAFPPIAEQTAIAARLNRAADGIDAAIGRARRQIELMEEYRTRLIADVVTGKIDVREESEQSLTTAVQYP